MSLLSTICRKSSVTGAGSMTDGTIPKKTKKLVIQEWPRVLERQPNLFGIVLCNSAARSNSVKKALGIDINENPADNEAFVKIWPIVRDFFHKLIITMHLDDDLLQTACEQLGARHVDYIPRGFHSNFWDIFLVCMNETVEETLCEYFDDKSSRAEVMLAFKRVFDTIVHHMRTGYTERRKERLKNCHSL